MRSKTKYDINAGQVRAIFGAAGLGEVTGFESLSDGWYNNVLRVTAGGADYVLKVAPPPEVAVLTHERGLMRQELRYYALLRERTAVRSPRILREDLTRELIPCDYFIMEFLPGQRLDKAKLTKEEKDRADRDVLGILAQFHSVAGEGFGYEQMGLEPNWYLALRKMTRALADDCARFGKRCPLGEKLLGYIDRHRALLESVPGVLVNFDLHAMNIFIHEGELTILDLERCFWGDRLGDSVLRGYTMPKDAPEEEQIRFYLAEAYLAVIMHTEKY
ncbi:MAG: aminoglycoside phosphotransferase family protein, partial [Oscillospiraceae bacterium]|nr:aminoglycoside phosphotransferase family protein [Oscillospiraceae bacterium]